MRDIFPMILFETSFYHVFSFHVINRESLFSDTNQSLFISQNKRRAQLLTVSFTQDTEGKINSCSRSTPLPSYKLQDLVDVSMQVINKTNSAPANADVW